MTSLQGARPSFTTPQSVVEEAEKCLDNLKAEFSRSERRDIAKCCAHLNRLKMLSLDFASTAFRLNCSDKTTCDVVRLNSSNAFQKELLIMRESLEVEAVLAAINADVKRFAKTYRHLGPYYHELRPLTGSSQKEALIVGLYLLHLLCDRKIGDFHCEIALLSQDVLDSPYVKYAGTMEQALMDGNYPRIVEKSGVPDPLYEFFTARLVEAVRGTVASCMEHAYEKLSVESACRTLLLKDSEELARFAARRNASGRDAKMAEEAYTAAEGATDERSMGGFTWNVGGDTLAFKRASPRRCDWQANEVLTNAIGYGIELERVI